MSLIGPCDWCGAVGYQYVPPVLTDDRVCHECHVGARDPAVRFVTADVLRAVEDAPNRHRTQFWTRSGC